MKKSLTSPEVSRTTSQNFLTLKDINDVPGHKQPSIALKFKKKLHAFKGIPGMMRTRHSNHDLHKQKRMSSLIHLLCFLIH